MKNTSISLPDAYVELLDQISKELETTRSALLRRATTELLKTDDALIAEIRDKTPFSPGKKSLLEYINDPRDFLLIKKSVIRTISAIKSPEERIIKALLAEKRFTKIAKKKKWANSNEEFSKIILRSKKEILKKELNSN